MTNAFSIDLHRCITERIASADEKRRSAGEQGDPARARYFEGQLQALREVRTHLTQAIDLETQRYY